MVLKQVTIFGGLEPVKIKKDQRKKENNKNKVLKEKITLLYNLYYQLYTKQNIDIFEQKEIILKDNIIIYVDEKQAEPIEFINLALIENIDKKIERMKELCENK